MMRAHHLLIGAILLLASAVRAEDVGTVAAVRGAAEIGRGGVRTAAAVGMAVQLGDELHTGDDGQLRVVFRDDSVIDLTENSSLVVDQQVFDPAASSFSSVMRLVAGRARALVGEYYRTPGAAYQVETPTAVAGVRGTSFLVVYDPDSDATEVIGIDGRIEVRSLGERAADRLRHRPRGDHGVARRGADGTGADGRPALPPAVEGSRRSHSATSAAWRRTVRCAPAPPFRRPTARRRVGLAGQLGRDELRNTGDVAGQPLRRRRSRGSLGVPF